MFWLVALYLLYGSLILALPFGLVFALNTLFGLGLHYSLTTWLAAAVLLAVVNTTRIK